MSRNNGRTINGSDTGNTLFGTDKNETINAKRGGDTVYGAGGNDLIRGDDGADILYGDAAGVGSTDRGFGLGNDRLQGGSGNDSLFGQGGDDTLEGGSGDDLLEGGIGNDRFVFENKRSSNGFDVITDYVWSDVPGEEKDLLDLSRGAVSIPAGRNVNDYVWLQAGADGATLYIDRDGSASRFQAESWALLEGLSGGDLVRIRTSSSPQHEYTLTVRPATFTVIQEPSKPFGTWTVGNLNGDVTITLVGGNYVFTPTVGDPVSLPVANVYEIVVDGITVTGALEIFNYTAESGIEVSGTGDVVVTIPETDPASAQSLNARVLFNLDDGDVTFDFPEDDNDALALSADSKISLGGGTLTVDDGNLDVTAVPPADFSVGNVVVNSGIELTVSQLANVEGTVETSGTGGLQIVVTTAAEAALLASILADKLPAGSQLAIAVAIVPAAGEDAGAIDGLVAAQAQQLAEIAGQPVDIELSDGNDLTLPGPNEVVLISASGLSTYSSIQAAADAASDGDTLLIGSGTFSETVTIGKELTLVGWGNSSDPALGTVIDGNVYLKSGNVSLSGVYVDASGLADGIFLQAGVGAGPGNLTSYQNVSLDDVSVVGATSNGVHIHSYVEAIDMVLTDCTLSGNGVGLRSASVSSIDGLTITGGTIANNGTFGILTNGGGSPSAGYSIDGVSITGTAFTNNGANWPATNPPVDNNPNNGDLALFGYTGTALTLEDLVFTTETRSAILVGGNGQSSDAFVFANIAVTADADSAFRVVKLEGLVPGTQSFADLLDAISLTGTTAVFAEISGTTGSDNITGTDYADLIKTSDGNDDLTGGGGNDYLQGGTGTDTANYTTSLTADMVTTVTDAYPYSAGDQAGWQLATGTGEGTDLLTGVEVLDDGDGSEIYLVGNGAFSTLNDALTAVGTPSTGDTVLTQDGGSLVWNGTSWDITAPAGTVWLFDASGNFVSTHATIQGGIDAAAAGYTVAVGAGTYAEALVINKEIHLVGAGSGSVPASDTIIDPVSNNSYGSLDGIWLGIDSDGSSVQSLRITGATNGIQIEGGTTVMGPQDLLFRDLAIVSNTNYGINLRNGITGDVTVEDCVLTGNGTVGIRVPSSGTYGNITVTGSVFDNNGVQGFATLGATVASVTITDTTFQHNGTGGTTGNGDLILNAFSGDATLSNLSIIGDGSGANGLQVSGPTTGSGAEPDPRKAAGPIGTVVIEDVTVTGSYARDVVTVGRYTDLDGLSVTNLDIQATQGALPGWAQFNVFNTGGDIDLADYGLASEGLRVNLSSNNGVDYVSATVTDYTTGAVLTGGDGVDALAGHVLGDELIGKDGADYLVGGAGNDVFTYTAASESGAAAKDVIADFKSAGATDVIDLSAVLPAAQTSLTQLVAALDGTAGEFGGNAIAWYQDGTDTQVYVDTSGDGAFGAGDMQIQLTGTVSLVLGDFVTA